MMAGRRRTDRLQHCIEELGLGRLTAASDNQHRPGAATPAARRTALRSALELADEHGLPIPLSPSSRMFSIRSARRLIERLLQVTENDRRVVLDPALGADVGDAASSAGRRRPHVLRQMRKLTLRLPASPELHSTVSPSYGIGTLALGSQHPALLAGSRRRRWCRTVADIYASAWRRVARPCSCVRASASTRRCSATAAKIACSSTRRRPSARKRRMASRCSHKRNRQPAQLGIGHPHMSPDGSSTNTALRSRGSYLTRSLLRPAPQGGPARHPDR